MSRFVRYSTPLKNRPCIEEALRNMGFQILEDAPVRGYEGTLRAPLVAHKDGFYDIGFVPGNDGGFDVVADWMQTPMPREEFMEELQQYVGALVAVEGARRAGARDIRIERDAKGDLVVRGFRVGGKQVEARTAGGEIALDLRGFVGTECDSVVRSVSGAMDAVVLENRPKPEYGGGAQARRLNQSSRG